MVKHIQVHEYMISTSCTHDTIEYIEDDVYVQNGDDKYEG